MIHIKNISKKIQKKIIYEEISLNCIQNETYILVGPNGVGKTSLLKSILGFYSIDSGEITLLNQKIDKKYITNPNVGVFLDTAKMLPHNNVKDSLEFFVSLYDKNISDIENFIYYLHLEKELDKEYITLSSGNKRKLGILFSLINNPSLLIWDEPFATLDPEMCSELVEFIHQLKQDEKTIFLTTNDLFFADNLYDKVGFFLDSKTIIEKTREEIQFQYPEKKLNEIYFLVKKDFSVHRTNGGV